VAVNLTDPFVKARKPGARPIYIIDKTGLALRVAPNGVKTWSLRYRSGRRQRRLTLGGYPAVSLADARQRVRDALKLVSAGIDPAEVKTERRDADTVAEFAKTYIEKHAMVKKKSWKGDQSRLTNDVLPLWKNKLMRDITRRDVRELVDAIAARPAPISANRVRALLHKMFNVAIRMDVIESNPVTATDRPGVEQRRDRVLTPDEIRRLWTACDALPLEMGAGFKLRLLTAQRATEVLDMSWNELDLDGGWWTIGAERSKNGMSHRVPLSQMAIDILKAVRTKADETLKAQKHPKPSPHVLRRARGKRQQAEAAKTFKIANFRGHDLRRTVASLMTGSGTSRLVVSKILNHAEPGVTSVYDRHSYDNEKKIALDAWARMLTQILEHKSEGAVLPFTHRGA
jgi:integrase